MSSFTIFLIGEISSGKSSFLNALAGYPISSVSLQRETFRPLGYNFSQDKIKNLKVNGKKLDAMHNKNLSDRENISNINIDNIKTIDWSSEDIPLLFEHKKKLHLIDFPGINDAEDKTDMFMKCIEENFEMVDLVIYLTDATRAFNSTSEIEHFNKIKKMVNNKNSNGKYTNLIVVDNKFDDIDDDDFKDIYKRIQKKITSDDYKINNDRIFKFSSHRYFLKRYINNKVNIKLPECFKKEIKQILKNNYCWSQKIVTDIKNGYLNCENVERELNLKENDLHGDWNMLIKYIKNNMDNIENLRDETMINYLNGELTKTYYSNYDDLIKKIYKSWFLINNKNVMIKFLDDIIIHNINDKRYESYNTHVMAKFIELYNILKISMCIFKKIFLFGDKRITNNTNTYDEMLFLTMINFNMLNSSNVLMLREFLTRIKFNNSKIDYINCSITENGQQEIKKIKTFTKSYDLYDSNRSVPASLDIILKIANLKPRMIIYLDNKEKLPINVFNEYNIDHYKLIEYCYNNFQMEKRIDTYIFNDIFQKNEKSEMEILINGL